MEEMVEELCNSCLELIFASDHSRSLTLPVVSVPVS